MGKAFDIATFRIEKSTLQSKLRGFEHKPDFISQANFGNLANINVREYPIADSEKIFAACESARWAVENQSEVDEPYWRSVAVGLGKFCEDGAVHRWSREHPTYTHEETERKLAGWKGDGATTCVELSKHNPTTCSQCPHWGKLNSPIVLGYPETPREMPLGGTRILTLDRGRVTNVSESPRREWTVSRFLPRRTVYTFGGLSGIAKTAVAVSLGVSVATGRPWQGLATQEGGVVMLLGEEDSREAVARINAACHGMSADEKTKALRHTLAFGLHGEDARMIVSADRQVKTTSFVQEVIDVSFEHAEEIGIPVTMIVLDHARVLASIDLNDGNAASVLMRSLGRIANETGACVLLVTHSPKGSIGREGDATAQDVSGSAALVDMARGAARARGMNEDERKLFGFDEETRKEYVAVEMFKANYAALSSLLWFRKVYDPAHDTVRVEPASPTPPSHDVKARKANSELAVRIVQAIEQHPGPIWVNRFLDRYAGVKKQLKASVAEVEMVLGNLRADGKITQREVTPQERDDYQLHHTVKSVLVVNIREKG